MQRVMIKDLRPKEEVESSYLVKFIQLVEAKDGKEYLNVILSDSSGDIEARVWSGAAELAEKINKGDFVKVTGKANIYQGRKQFIIQGCEQIDKDQVNEDDFIFSAQVNAEEMFKELYDIVLNLKDVYIRDLLKLVLDDAEVARRLKTWQAGKSIHHAYKSGLLEHVLSCVKLSLSLSAHYNVNENYVVAGAILHDLCKIYELSDGYNVDYTEEGKLVGHLVKGVELVDKYAYKIKNFPYDLKMHLKHILLSHHGYYEYGSPKIPQTSEAMLLHLIDHMDSKMHSFETVKRTDQNTGHWSGYVRHLDRIIFKTDLPFYDEYNTGSNSGNGSKQRPNHKSKSIKTKGNQEVKQNLGNLLKDFKVD